jgi:hypothetical protein
MSMPAEMPPEVTILPSSTQRALSKTSTARSGQSTLPGGLTAAIWRAKSAPGASMSSHQKYLT